MAWVRQRFPGGKVGLINTDDLLHVGDAMSQLDTMKEAARLREALQVIMLRAESERDCRMRYDLNREVFEEFAAAARAALQPEIPSEPPVTRG